MIWSVTAVAVAVKALSMPKFTEEQTNTTSQWIGLFLIFIDFIGLASFFGFCPMNVNLIAKKIQ